MKITLPQAVKTGVLRAPKDPGYFKAGNKNLGKEKNFSGGWWGGSLPHFLRTEEE